MRVIKEDEQKKVIAGGWYWKCRNCNISSWSWTCMKIHSLCMGHNIYKAY